MKKYQGIIFSVLSGIVILAGLYWVSRLNSAPSEPVEANAVSSIGALSVEESSFDFGNISMAKGKVSHIFKVKNTGSEAVVLSKLYTSCMCTIASLKNGGSEQGPFGMLGHGYVPSFKEVLSPGGEAEVEVVFDPAAHGPAGVGKISRVVSLENNSKGGQLDIEISANVTP